MKSFDPICAALAESMTGGEKPSLPQAQIEFVRRYPYSVGVPAMALALEP